jgi:hypothetical protein
MRKPVYVNGRAIACAAAKGRVLAAFPDVCLSPPSPPGGPVPVMYPVSASAGDLVGGSTSVLIAKQPIYLMNRSRFRLCQGDAAATRGLGQGVLSHTIGGECRFVTSSIDVQVENQFVSRHLDTVTCNHQGMVANTAPWPYIDHGVPAMAGHPACTADRTRITQACAPFAPNTDRDACAIAGAARTAPQVPDDGDPAAAAEVEPESPAPVTVKRKPMTQREATALAQDLADDAPTNDAERDQARSCVRARRCELAPYASRQGEARCCGKQTPHHLVLASAVHDCGRGGRKKLTREDRHRTSVPLLGIHGYDAKRAPCVCAEGQNQKQGSHGWLHTLTSYQGTQTPDRLALLPLDPAVIARIQAAGAHAEMQMEERAEKGVVYDPQQGWCLSCNTLTYAEAREHAITAMRLAFDGACDDACIRAQLDDYHHACGITDQTRIKRVLEGRYSEKAVKKAGGAELIKDIKSDAVKGLSIGRNKAP